MLVSRGTAQAAGLLLIDFLDLPASCRSLKLDCNGSRTGRVQVLPRGVQPGVRGGVPHQRGGGRSRRVHLQRGGRQPVPGRRGRVRRPHSAVHASAAQGTYTAALRSLRSSKARIMGMMNPHAVLRFRFQDVLGRSSSVVYAVALLASGQSTTISCTFAGQVIMQVINQIDPVLLVNHIVDREN